MRGWRSMPPEVLEREYSPSSTVPGGYARFVRLWADGTERARRLPGARLDARYGPGPDDLLDLYLPVPPPDRPPPLVVFLHGGYWQEVSKAESGFAAPGLVAAGITLVVPEYTLAPRASVREIVDQTTRAVRWLADHAAEIGVDGDRVVLAGHSAGAQLAVMAALALSPGTATGLVLLGGVFDLEPLAHTPINDALGLDEAEARRLSPVRLVRPGLPPALVILGTGETDEFRRQSREFAAACVAAGNEVAHLEVEGRHHFDLPLDLGDPSTELGARAMRLARTGRL